MAQTDLQRSAPRTMIKDKGTLKGLLDSQATQEMMKNVASKYMTEDRIAKAALLALSRQPKLAGCTTVSFLTSMMKAAQLGLDFSGATGQAYLIPYKQECTLIVGYQGMIEVAYRSKNVEYIDAQLVYENDECIFNLGTDPKVAHVPCMDGDRGEVKFGYAVARLKGVSIPKIELMSKAEIMAIKARSPSRGSGPWQTDEPEMMRKTVIRRIFKYLPKTQEILTAAEIDNMSYDYGNRVAEDMKTGVAGLRDRIKENAPTKEETRPVESTVTDTPQPEPEKPKRGRKKDSKNKKKAEAKSKPTTQPKPQPRTRPEVPEFNEEPESEEIQQEQPTAEKLEDYLYNCLKCGHKFDKPLLGAGNKTQCPNCLTYEIAATADQK